MPEQYIPPTFQTLDQIKVVHYPGEYVIHLDDPAAPKEHTWDQDDIGEFIQEVTAIFGWQVIGETMLVELELHIGDKLKEVGIPEQIAGPLAAKIVSTL